MRYRKLDASGDYTFGSGSSCFITDHDAVVQAIVTRLKLWKYEWWEDLEEGIPMRDLLGSRDLDLAEREIKDRVLGTIHVNSLLFLNSYIIQIRASSKFLLSWIQTLGR